MVTAFVLAVPWIIYGEYFNIKDNMIDIQKFYEIRKDSYNLIAKLIRQSDFKMREVLLNSIINQIKYPNLFTSYFINFVLIIFLDGDNEVI